MSWSVDLMPINPKQFYHSPAWFAKRAEILQRDNYECQMCKSKGKYSKAECVHHIKHLLKREDLALVDDNLLSLCNVCHNIEHPEKLYYRVKKRRVISDEKW